MTDRSSATSTGPPSRGRLAALLLLVGSGALLAVGSSLEAAEAGVGTHVRLGLPACGFLRVTGAPCATCGMTTAFAHAAEGDLVSSFVAQPMGAVLAVVAAVVLVVGTYTALTGSRLATLFGRLGGRRAAWALVLGFGGAWLYKVATYKDLLG